MMKQKHICIYTTPETLAHKKEPDMHCYWELSNTPKLIQEIDKMIDDDTYKDEGEDLRLYFATKGFI